ncbi:amino acid permease 4-like [Nymphaea colorata]|uniref:amino acid permease 4-like n=1 Tax=Nymphaea colorata TaxID=210225 RepID=UPI00129DB327|nr:amino acid permease 4-like [Nymphaea colorata]
MEGAESRSMACIESGGQDFVGRGDEGDGGHVRTGTVWTATAHIITAVIGAGVLGLPWSVAQLGWVLGPAAILLFAWVTYYTALLLADCYRYPDKAAGQRNRVYMDAVSTILGPKQEKLCGVAQHIDLWGALIGYTITTSTSMMAVKKSNCFHKYGHDSECRMSGNLYMILFGVIEIVLAQLPNLEKVTLLSIIAAIMSFAYSLIGLGLCIAKVAMNGKLKGSLTGTEVNDGGMSLATKTWNAFQALGNIAFAYTYAVVLIEIQDTMKSPPPENESMRRANFYAVGVTTVFYMTLGCIGYAAFGNSSPGNFLTGFGFYEPYWLIDIGNICVIVHLVGAYQVYAQPIFFHLENWIAKSWPAFYTRDKVYRISLPKTTTMFEFTIMRLVVRSSFIVLMTLVAMIIPFFNAVMGLLGALTFWPLTVYFPVSMYMVQEKVKRQTFTWFRLKFLDLISMVVCILAAVGSVAGIIDSLKHAAPFKSSY